MDKYYNWTVVLSWHVNSGPYIQTATVGIIARDISEAIKKAEQCCWFSTAVSFITRGTEVENAQ